MSTIWQQNAADFASKPAPYIDQERHAGVREALEHILAGRPGRAQYALARSVQRQARIAGLGTPDLQVCACGGRCRDFERGLR